MGQFRIPQPHHVMEQHTFEDTRNSSGGRRKHRFYRYGQRHKCVIVGSSRSIVIVRGEDLAQGWHV